MQSHEYRVVPAPRRGLKAKGVRRPEDRFASAIEFEMNRMAAEGWEFVRSDTLPCEQKQGWFSRPVTVFQTLLVFRRPLAEAATQAARAPMPPPVALTPPASVAAPPPLAATPPAAVAPAPAASRFAPVPEAPRPAKAGAPTLTVVEPPEPPPSTLALFGELTRAMEKRTARPDDPDSRQAAE